VIRRSWRVAAVLSLLSLALAVVTWRQGTPGTAAGFGVAAVLLLWLMSPVPFPRPVSAEEASRRSAADGMPIVYWRPGCQFCLRLRAALGRDASRAHWVDIWQDPDGAAAVRAITGGDETVPTVVIDGTGHVNPSPALVKAALRRS
jgi:mycoredoxin